MALGGGTFIAQNKVLPGAYINFVSAASASATLSDRGIATMALELDWGVDGEVFTVTSGDFIKKSREIFGYSYTDEKLKGIRDIFKYARILYAYKLTSGGAKASNTFATAKYSGTRGNALKTVIKKDVDNEELFVVSTYLDSELIDEQTVGSAAELVSNDYVDFKAGATLAETAGLALSGGTNGTVSGSSHQAYLDKIEAYSFNAMGCISTEEAVKGLYAAFVKRMRDEVGKKFQLVLYNYPAADYLGTISVKNAVSDEGASAASLVYWTTGAQAGCAVNKSLMNKLYDGEYSVSAPYTQEQLEAAIFAGEFVFHKVGDDIRVLEDINTKVTVSDTEGDVFKENQTIRVIDQIGNDIATIFNTKYLGTVPNDEAGRLALWADIVKHHKELSDIRAIEGFTDGDVTVAQGDSKKAVVVTDAITVINAMAKLYMTVTVA